MNASNAKVAVFGHGVLIMTSIVLSFLIDDGNYDWTFLAVILGFGSFSLLPSFLMLEKKHLVLQAMLSVAIAGMLNFAVANAAEIEVDITSNFITAQLCGNGSVVLMDEKFQKDEQLYYSCVTAAAYNHGKLGLKNIHNLCVEYKSLRTGGETQLCEFAFKNYK